MKASTDPEPPGRCKATGPRLTVDFKDIGGHYIKTHARTQQPTAKSYGRRRAQAAVEYGIISEL